MNTIIFPGLGLKIGISKIAFEIFGITISWYAVLIVLALILAIVLLNKKNGLYNISYENIITLALYLIPACFISARVYYVIFNWRYFANNLNEILNIRQGGLAIYGGIIGGVIICYFFCRKRNIQLLDLLDYIVPTLALRTSNRKMGELY